MKTLGPGFQRESRNTVENQKVIRMTNENHPIAHESMDIMPKEFAQPGFQNIRLYINEITQGTSTPVFGTLPTEWNPKNEEAFSDVADDDTDLAEAVDMGHYFMRGLLGQAMDWINTNAYSGAWADIADSDTTKLLFPWYTLFRNMLLGKAPITYKEDGSTASTTLAEAIQGLDWNDEAIGGTPQHYQFMYRWAHFFGRRYQKLVPNLTDKLDAATETHRKRIEMILAALAAIEFCYMFPLLVLQSERAMFSLAALHESDLNRKFEDPSKLMGTVDDVWRKFTAKEKYNSISTNMTNYVFQSSRYINPVALEGESLDTAFKRARNTYRVPTFAVNFAKTFAGIAKYEGLGTEDHFALLWTFGPKDNAIYDAIAASAWTHGEADWLLGVDLAICLDWLTILDGWLEEACHVLVKNRTHYSWAGPELSKIVDDMWIDFNFIDTISGYASPTVGRVVERHYRAVDNVKATVTAIGGGAMVVTQTAKMVNGSYEDAEDWDNTIFQIDLYDNHWAWLSLLIHGYEDHSMRLLSTGGMTLEEMAVDFLLGMLVDTNRPAADREEQMYLTRIRASTIIDSYNNEKEYGFCRSVTAADQANIGDVDDQLNYSTAFTAIHGLGLSMPGAAFARGYTGPRPKGMSDKKVTFIPDWGKRETKLAMMDVMWSILGSNSPIKPIGEAAPKVEAKPKEVKKADPVVFDKEKKTAKIEAAPEKIADPKKINTDDNET